MPSLLRNLSKKLKGITLDPLADLGGGLADRAGNTVDVLRNAPGMDQVADFGQDLAGRAGNTVDVVRDAPYAQGLSSLRDLAGRYGNAMMQVGFGVAGLPTVHDKNSATDRAIFGAANVIGMANPMSQPLQAQRVARENPASSIHSPMDALKVIGAPASDFSSSLHDTTMPIQTGITNLVNRGFGYDDYGPLDTRSLSILGQHAGLEPPKIDPKTGQPLPGAVLDPKTGKVIEPDESGLRRTIGRLASMTIDVGTNPLTYVGEGALESVPALGRIPLMFTGVGYGGSTVTQNMARAGLFTTFNAVTPEVLRATGMDPQSAEYSAMILNLFAIHTTLKGISGLPGMAAAAPYAAAHAPGPLAKLALSGLEGLPGGWGDFWKTAAPNLSALTRYDSAIRQAVSEGKVSELPDELIAQRNSRYLRMFHGTSTTYGVPDPGLFNKNGWYGPGYYITSDPRVAGGLVLPDGSLREEGYAQVMRNDAANPEEIERYERTLVIAREKLASWQQIAAEPDPVRSKSGQIMSSVIQESIDEAEAALAKLREQPQGAPQVRPVLIPESFNLINMEQPLDEAMPALLQLVKRNKTNSGAWISNEQGAAQRVLHGALDDARQRMQRGYAGTVEDIYRSIESSEGGGPDGKAAANKIFALLGYDGILHEGGRNSPMIDEAGNPINHTVIVVFAESQQRIINGLSGTAMGIIPIEEAAKIGEKRLPEDELFDAALRHTPGFGHHEAGVMGTVERYDQPANLGRERQGAGVFYGTTESSQHYEGGSRYGGKELTRGTSVWRRPLMLIGGVGDGPYVAGQFYDEKVSPAAGKAFRATLDGMYRTAQRFGASKMQRADQFETMAADFLIKNKVPQEEALDLARRAQPLIWSEERAQAPGGNGHGFEGQHLQLWSGSLAEAAMMARARQLGYDSIFIVGEMGQDADMGHAGNLAEARALFDQNKYRPEVKELIDLRENTTPAPHQQYTLNSWAKAQVPNTAWRPIAAVSEENDPSSLAGLFNRVLRVFGKGSAESLAPQDEETIRRIAQGRIGPTLEALQRARAAGDEDAASTIQIALNEIARIAQLPEDLRGDNQLFLRVGRSTDYLTKYPTGAGTTGSGVPPWEMTRAQFEAKSNTSNQYGDVYTTKPIPGWEPESRAYLSAKKAASDTVVRKAAADLGILAKASDKSVPVSDLVRRPEVQAALVEQGFDHWVGSVPGIPQIDAATGLPVMDASGQPVTRSTAAKLPFDRNQVMTHEDAVRMASALGLPLRPEVLADYPHIEGRARLENPPGSSAAQTMMASDNLDVEAARHAALDVLHEIQARNDAAGPWAGKAPAAFTDAEIVARNKPGVMPPDARTPEGLAQLEQYLTRLTLEGMPGRYWYENSSLAVLSAFGGDREAAAKFVKMLAIYSPQNTVENNAVNAIRVHNQFASGVDRVRGGNKGDLDLKARAVFASDDAWKGTKTNNFYRNMMLMIDPQGLRAEGDAALEHGVTVDIWMMRAFGYEGRVGDTKLAPTTAQYDWVANITKRIAAQLGEGPDGRPWEPHQVQAAIWVAAQPYWNAAVKDLSGGNKKIGEGLSAIDVFHKMQGYSPELAEAKIATAAGDFSHALEANASYIHQETAPGLSGFGYDPGGLVRPGSTRVPGYFFATPELQKQFSDELWQTVQDSMGNDRVARTAGALTAMPVQRGEAVGVFEGQNNPVVHVPIIQAPRQTEKTYDLEPMLTRQLARIAGMPEGPARDRYAARVKGLLFDRIPDDVENAKTTKDYDPSAFRRHYQDRLAELVPGAVSESPGPAKTEVIPPGKGQLDWKLKIDRSGDLKGQADVHSHRMADTLAALYGLIFRQDAVAWTKFYPVTEGKADTVGFSFGRKLATEEVARITEAAKAHLDPDGAGAIAVLSTDDGVILRRLDFNSMPAPEFLAKATQIIETESRPLDAISARHYTADGGYITNNWLEHPDGEGYRRSFHSRRSGEFDALITDVRARVAAVEDKYIAEHGWDRGAGAGTAAGAAEGASPVINIAQGPNPIRGAYAARIERIGQLADAGNLSAAYQAGAELRADIAHAAGRGLLSDADHQGLIALIQRAARTDPNAGATAAQASFVPGLTQLSAGLRLPGTAGALAGAAYGATQPADNPEERFQHILAGGATGAGAGIAGGAAWKYGASPAGRFLLSKTLAPNVAAPQELRNSLLRFSRELENWVLTKAPAAQEAAERQVAREFVGRVKATNPDWVAPGKKDGYTAVTIPGYKGPVWFHDDVAPFIQNTVGDTGDLSDLQKFASAINNNFKAPRLGADLALLGLRAPAAWLQAASASPMGALTGAGALVKGIFAASHPGGMDNLHQQSIWEAWSHRLSGTGYEERAKPAQTKKTTLGAALGSSGGNVATNVALEREGKPLVEKLPVIGKIFSLSEDFQFGNLMPAMKVYLAEALYQATKGQRAARGLTDDAIRDQIARRVDTIFNGMDRAMAGTSRQREAGLNAGFLLSTNFTRGVPKMMADVAKPGLEGALARRFWAGLVGIGIATSVGGSILMTNERDPDQIAAWIDPRNPNSLTNPNSPMFMQIKLPGGVGSFDPWGSASSFLKQVARPIASGIGAGAEARDANADLPLYQAISIGLQAAASHNGAAAQWLEGREGIPLGLIRDLRFTNKDYFGHKITTPGDADSQQLKDRLQYIGMQVLPGVSSVGYNADQSALPDFAVSRRNAVTAVGNVLGVRTRPTAEYPDEVGRPLETFLQAHGVDPGDDPVAAYKRSSDVITPEDRQLFLRRNQPVAAFLDQQKEQRAETIAQPGGGDAYSLFTADTTRLRSNPEQAHQILADFSAGKIDLPTFQSLWNNNAGRDDKIALLAQQFQGGTLTGNQYRQLRSQIMDEYFERVNGAAEARGLGRDPDVRQQNIDKLFGGKQETAKDDLTRANDLLDQIRPGDTTPEGTADAARRRTQYLITGVLRDASGKEIGRIEKETVTKLREYLVEKQANPVERAYETAALSYGYYQDLPRWRTIPQEWEPQVMAALNAASDQVRLGLAPDQRTALRRMVNLPVDVSNYARRVLDGGQTNPERAKFLKLNPQVGFFYSDLLPNQLAEIGGVP